MPHRLSAHVLCDLATASVRIRCLPVHACAYV